MSPVHIDSDAMAAGGHQCINLDATVSGAIASAPSGSTHLDITGSILDDYASSVKSANVTVNGSNLRIGHVAAVARHAIRVQLEKSKAMDAILDASVVQLRQRLQRNEVLYGITTGYGGSADTRTNDAHALQRSLIKLLSVGIQHDGHQCPDEIVAAAMAVRLNNSCRGHSAIRRSVLDTMARMLTHRILPIVPLRGSISASGDLIPFAAVARAMTGAPTAKAAVLDKSCPDVGDKALNLRRVVLARDALLDAEIEPVVFEPKEALALLNGTAFSSAAASVALFESHNLANATMVLTALCVEAMNGAMESFHPFLSQVRPHPGQVEAAASITRLLESSQLTSEYQNKEHSGHTLRQDRYALRTAPQWIGPQLETFAVASRTVEIELNSTTDNPIFDATRDEIVHGGNFQAMAVTSAMEHTRLALQHLGKLIFAQFSELVNAKSNNGLPANLAFKDASIDYGFKGVEISMASYMSELAYLANPVSTHVQTAELGNQAVNSLAFVSARYTLQAAGVLRMMAACHLYALFQAIHLRAIARQFYDTLRDIIAEAVAKHLDQLIATDEYGLEGIHAAVVGAFEAYSSMDASGRIGTALEPARALLVQLEYRSNVGIQQIQTGIQAFVSMVTERATLAFHSAREGYKETKGLEALGRTRHVANFLLRNGISMWRHDEQQDLTDVLTTLCGLFDNSAIYPVFAQSLET